MRSLRLLAATTVILFGAAACGDDDGNGPENEAPNASFTQVCTELSCVFTDASTDSDGSIASRSWSFESGTPPSSDQPTPTVTFAAAGTYTVTLTVTDNEGATDDVSQEVTVTAGTTNQAPVASFNAPTDCTVNSACPFADTSTDPDGQVTAWAWNFGDGTPVDNNQTTNHTFAVAGTYQVQLTVTDNLGATNSVTVPVTIAPASATQCTTLGLNEVDCALAITQQSTITITLTGEDCELGGSLVHIPPPGVDTAQNVFTNVCDAQTIGTQRTLTTEAGAPLVFPAGSTLHVRLRRGTGTPEPGSPAGDITGTYPTWTLNFDDGGNPGGAGEPDFSDIVLSVQATAAP